MLSHFGTSTLLNTYIFAFSLSFFFFLHFFDSIHLFWQYTLVCGYFQTKYREFVFLPLIYSLFTITGDTRNSGLFHYLSGWRSIMLFTFFVYYWFHIPIVYGFISVVIYSHIFLAIFHMFFYSVQFMYTYFMSHMQVLPLLSIFFPFFSFL